MLTLSNLVTNITSWASGSGVASNNIEIFLQTKYYKNSASLEIYLTSRSFVASQAPTSHFQALSTWTRQIWEGSCRTRFYLHKLRTFILGWPKYGIVWYCIYHHWFRRAGCISQDTYPTPRNALFVRSFVRSSRFLPPSNAHAHQSNLWACALDFGIFWKRRRMRTTTTTKMTVRGTMVRSEVCNFWCFCLES